MRPDEIDGWMNDAELAWLEQQARTRKVIVEFGCYKGRSTKALALSTPGVVHAVDWWPGDMLRDIFPVFTSALHEEIRSRKVLVYRQSTSDYYMHCGISAFADMVFIDASHDYQNVKDDIRYARYMLRAGGLLCGHDFSNDWPGVQQAVRELVPDYRRVPGGDIWFKEVTT